MCIRCLLDRVAARLIRIGRPVTREEAKHALDDYTGGRFGRHALESHATRLFNLLPANLREE